MKSCRITVSNAACDKRLTAVTPVALRPAAGSPWTVEIDPSKKDQSILGLGGVWTDTDLTMLLSMSGKKQEEVLQALFNPKTGAGWSFMRLPFGSTDWEVTTDYYTYDDVPYGEKDPELKNFSVQRDIDRGLFRVARRCREINPNMQFLGSVWGVPAWMKENNSIMFGRFDTAYTDAYARYLRKTVEAYRDEGIELYAVTTQNESLTSDDRATPACRFTWRMQKDVIIALKRDLKAAGLSTQVWIYDHNFDMARDFVEPMLADGKARAALDGVAFHDYGGSPTVMGELHRRYPEVPFYMTERNICTVPEMDCLVQNLRNGARSYAQWSVMTDEYGGPHQFIGKPFRYIRPRTEKDLSVIYNHKENPDDWRFAQGYGIYGQFTRFLQPGMVRVESTPGDGKWVTNVAFCNPESGDIVVLLVNKTNSAQPVTLLCGGYQADFVLEAMSVASCELPNPDSVSFPEAPAAFTAPEFQAEPAWDITPVEILVRGAAKAGEEIHLGCRVKNVGTLPTPKGASVFAEFSLDGDCLLSRGVALCGLLQPGEEQTVWANVPLKNCKLTWTAEAGWHNLFVYADLGTCSPEKNTGNNRLGTEIYFES